MLPQADMGRNPATRIRFPKAATDHALYRSKNKKAALISQSGLCILILATTYVPTQLPVQYHRPYEA
jgi:hypothetical protein